MRDCFLLAPVGSVVGDPERMKAMASEQGGDVSVHVGNSQTVTLPAPTDGEVVIGSTTLNDGVWGTVFEKAMGKLPLERTERHAGIRSRFIPA